MHDFAALFRTRFIRELWRRLGRDLGDRPIAIYGGGRHTAWLLDTIADIEDGPRIACILDDAGGGRTMAGIQVMLPIECDPTQIGAVFVSSDGAEAALAIKARSWVTTAPVSQQPVVIEPYRGLPPGPYPIGGSIVSAESDDHVLPSNLDEDAVARAKHLGVRYPIPAADNREGYAPESDSEYITAGKAERDTIGQICDSYGVKLKTASDILDWGSSTGRVLRHFDDLPDQTTLWGCDIDESSIEWAQRHFDGRFRFFSTTLEPSLPVPDSSFDFVYGMSVFTHISHNIDTWLMELRRIVRPDGAVLVTVHDENSWEYCSKNPDCYFARHSPRLDFSSPLTHDFVANGQGPASQAFWHSKGIHRRWSHAFEICGIEPMKFCSGMQAGVLLRPRG